MSDNSSQVNPSNLNQHYQSGASTAPLVHLDQDQKSPSPNKAASSLAGSMDKERERFPGVAFEIDPTNIESPEDEMPFEVQEYLEKIEKQNLELQKPIVHHGKPVLESAHPTNFPHIILPLTRTRMHSGLQQKVSESIRWLSVWCVRIIKKFPGQVIYTPENTARHQQQQN